MRRRGRIKRRGKMRVFPGSEDGLNTYTLKYPGATHYYHTLGL